MKKTISFTAGDGTIYDIPEEQVEAFKTDFPDARQSQSFRVGETDYAIPDDMVSDFRKDFPDATPMRVFQMNDGTMRRVASTGKIQRVNPDIFAGREAMGGMTKGALEVQAQGGPAAAEDDGSFMGWLKNAWNTFSHAASGKIVAGDVDWKRKQVMRGVAEKDGGKEVSFMDLPDSELDDYMNSIAPNGYWSYLGNAVGLNIKNDIMSQWDKTQGSKITDPAERKAARVKYAMDLARMTFEQNEQDKELARAELEGRDKQWQAGMTSGLVQIAGYATPMAAPGIGIGLSAAVEGTTRRNELLADKYETDEDGNLYRVAEGDSRGSALGKGSVGGLATAVVEKFGGKIVGGALGKIPGVKKVAGKIADTKLGHAVNKWMRTYDKYMGWSGVHSAPEEFAEEFVQGTIDAALGLNELEDEKSGTTAFGRTKGFVKEFFSPKNLRDLGESMILMQMIGGGGAYFADRYSGAKADKILKRIDGIDPDKLKDFSAEDKWRAVSAYYNGMSEEQVAEVVSSGAKALDGLLKKFEGDAVKTADGRAGFAEAHPEAAKAIRDARRKGEDVSRKMLRDIGISEEVLSDKDARNAFGDDLLTDSRRAAAVKRAKMDGYQANTLAQTVSEFVGDTPEAQRVFDRIVMKLKDASVLDDPYQREKLVMQAVEAVYAEDQAQRIGGARQKARQAERADHEARLAEAEAQAAEQAHRAEKDAQERANAELMARETKRYNDFMLAREEARTKGGLNETRTDETQQKPEQTPPVTPPAGEEARPVETAETPAEVGGEVEAPKTAIEAPTSAATETKVNAPPTTTESAEGGSRVSDAVSTPTKPKTVREGKAFVNSNIGKRYTDGKKTYEITGLTEDGEVSVKETDKIGKSRETTLKLSGTLTNIFGTKKKSAVWSEVKAADSDKKSPIRTKTTADNVARLADETVPTYLKAMEASHSGGDIGEDYKIESDFANEVLKMVKGMSESELGKVSESLRKALYAKGNPMPSGYKPLLDAARYALDAARVGKDSVRLPMPEHLRMRVKTTAKTPKTEQKVPKAEVADKKTARVVTEATAPVVEKIGDEATISAPQSVEDKIAAMPRGSKEQLKAQHEYLTQEIVKAKEAIKGKFVPRKGKLSPHDQKTNAYDRVKDSGDIPDTVNIKVPGDGEITVKNNPHGMEYLDKFAAKFKMQPSGLAAEMAAPKPPSVKIADKPKAEPIEKETKDFVSKDKKAIDYLKPYSGDDGYVYATDGRIIVRRKLRKGEKTPSKASGNMSSSSRSFFEGKTANDYNLDTAETYPKIVQALTVAYKERASKNIPIVDIYRSPDGKIHIRARDGRGNGYATDAWSKNSTYVTTWNGEQLRDILKLAAKNGAKKIGLGLDEKAGANYLKFGDWEVVFLSVRVDADTRKEWDAEDAANAESAPKSEPKEEAKAEVKEESETKSKSEIKEPKSETAPSITPAEAMRKLGFLGAADVNTLSKALTREERAGHTERANMIRVLRDYKRGVGTNENPQSDETSGGKYRASVEAAKPLDDPAFVAWAKKRGVAPTTQKRNEYDKVMADTLKNRLSRWIKGVSVKTVNFIAPEEGGDVRAAKKYSRAGTVAQRVKKNERGVFRQELATILANYAHNNNGEYPKSCGLFTSDAYYIFDIIDGTPVNIHRMSLNERNREKIKAFDKKYKREIYRGARSAAGWVDWIETKHVGVLSGDNGVVGNKGADGSLLDGSGSKEGRGLSFERVGAEKNLGGEEGSGASSEAKNQTVYLHDGERIVGSYNRATGEVKLAKGASVETVLHELGWHAARHWSEVNADSDPKAKSLLEQMKKYAESAPTEIKDAVRDVYGDLDADTLLDEIGAARFTKEQSGKIAEALATKEGAAWYQKVWNKVVDFFKNFLTKIGYNRVDLDGIENMSPEVFGDFLADVMMSGKQLGERTAFSMEAPKGLGAKWTNNLSDYKAPIAELEKRVMTSSNKIYYLARTLEGMAQRGKNRAERAIKRVEKILGEDISPELLAQYMQLKAYEERNAKIERRNGKADASGMTPEDARAIEKTIKDSGVDEAIFEEAAQILWDLQKEGLQARVDAGLLDQETANKWMTDEPHHIPWKDAVDPDSGEYVGRKVGASEFDTAEGRKTAASGDPITWMLQEYQDAMTRAAQNRLRSAIANLTRLNGDVGTIYDGIQTDSKGKRSFIKYPKDGGKAKVLSIPEGVKIESTVKNDGGMKNVLTFKEGGKTKYLVLNGTLGEAVAGAVTGRTLSRPPAWISGTMRLYAATATSLSPAFAARNITADNFDIHNNLVAKHGWVKGEKMFGKIVKEQVLMTKQLGSYIKNGDFKLDKDGKATDFQKLVEAYEDAGGLIGGMATEGYDATVRKIQADFRAGRNKARSIGKSVATYWTMMQRMSELAPRLAVFKTAMESGMSAKEAAMLSREITVDFNKKGEKTPWFNTLWMFSNSALGANLMQMKGLAGKTGAKLAGGLVMYGFAEGLLEALMNGDDDEREKEGLASGEDINEYTRQNSLYIRRGDKVFRVNIHMGPFAYAKYFGNVMARTFSGMISPEKAAKELGLTAAEVAASFTGLGNVSGDALVQTAVPTIIQPFVQIATNKDYAGRIVKKEKYPHEKHRPYSSLGRKSTPSAYHWMAKRINEFFGGSDYRKGSFLGIADMDVAPETVKILTEMVGKNFVKDIMEISETGYKLLSGNAKDLDVRNVPFAGDVVRKQEGNDSRFYESLNRYGADKEELKDPLLKGDERRAYLKEHPWLYSAGKPGVTRIDNIVKRIEKLRDVEESDRATEERKAEAKAMRRKLQARVIEIMKGK